MEMPIEIPQVFVWSRIGPEGGFTLEQIIYWKEMQRSTGNGIFWWGVGNAPAKEKVRAVLQQPRPIVLFSVQKKQEHGDRRQRILWTTYIDTDGTERELGENVHVTSESIPERPQKAIVAKSQNPIRIESGIGFDLGLVRHYGGKKRIGQSVTSVLEKDPKGSPTGELYDQGFKCTLINIFELKGYRKLDERVARDLDHLVSRRPSVDEFKHVMKQIRDTR